MLPVSLDCPFLVTPSVFSNVYLTSSKQYFSYIHDKNELTVYKQYIMQVHWWHYIYIITFLVSNVPCVFGLSILDLPLRLQFSLSYMCGCIMVIDRHVYWTPWYSWNIAKVVLNANQSINVYGSIIIIIVVHHSFALRLNLNYTEYQCFLWTSQSVNTSSLNKVCFCFTVSDDQ
jgi:hypothetical protein